MVCYTADFSALQVVVLHSLEPLFTGVHLHLHLSFLFGLVPPAGRILRGLENITGLRYNLHTYWTLPNFYYGLLHILVFYTPSCSYTL